MRRPAGSPADLGWLAVHARLAEASILLAVALFLVRHVRLGRWRGILGRIDDGKSPAADPVDWHDRYLARVVERAAARLPFTTKCLPRAMALQAMLRLRGRRSSLVMGVLPGADRGGLEDLHAWVERGQERLIGFSAEPYVVIARLTG